MTHDSRAGRSADVADGTVRKQPALIGAVKQDGRTETAHGGQRPRV